MFSHRSERRKTPRPEAPAYRAVTAAGMLLVFTAAATAAPIDGPRPGAAARLDEYLTRLADFGYSGAVLVAHEGTLLLDKGYGLARESPPKPVTTATVFDVCSFTKQFTAAAILKLESEGRLRTQDRLSAHIDGVPADKADITLHHLLTHTAGLDDPPADDYERLPRDAYAKQVLATTLLWPPGTRYAYSNGGYSLLGLVVEKRSGLSYEEFLDRKLFGPLAIARTGYRPSKWEAADVAYGYNDGDEFGSPLDHPGPYQPEDGRWPGPYWALATNGGVLSTTGDLLKWLRGLEGDAVLPAESRRRLFAPHVLAPEWGNETSYAYGWNVTRTPRGTTLVHHTGSSATFNAWVHRYVDERTSVVLLSNRILEGVRLTRGIYQAVDRILFGAEPAWPPAARRHPSRAELLPHAGLYRLPGGETVLVEARDGFLEVTGRGQRAVDALAFGGQDPARDFPGLDGRLREIFDGLSRGDGEPYRKVLWSERRFDEEKAEVERFWRGLERSRGALRDLRLAGSGPHEFVRQVYVTLSFERGTDVRALVQANATGQIALSTRLADARVPTRFRFLPQTEREFESFDVRLASGTRISFEPGGAGEPQLRIRTASGDVVARRETAAATVPTAAVRISNPPPPEDPAWKCWGQPAPDLSQVVENEPHAASDPSDRRTIVAAWHAITKSGRTILTSASGDSGASWSPPRALRVNACASGPDPTLPRTSDPFVAFGPGHRVYVAAIGWAPAPGNGPDPANALFVAASPDGGRTFEPIVTAAPSRAPYRTFDNVALAADPRRPGVLYLTSTLYEVPRLKNTRRGEPAPLTPQDEAERLGRGVVLLSTDGGRTWSEPRPVTPAAPGGRVSAPQVAVDPRSGRVAMAYYWADGGKRGLAAVVSDDAGATWSEPGEIADFVPIARHEDPRDGQFVQLAQDILSLASHPGGGFVLAVADGRYSGGKTGAVSVTRSRDGRAWTPLLRVSSREKATAWLAAVAVGQDGRVGVAYMTAVFGGEKTRPFPVQLRRATFGTAGDGLAPLADDLLDEYGYVWPGDYLGLVPVYSGFRAVYAKSNYGPDEAMPATAERKRTDVFAR
jgi:CubicO group peptidase (beta-lactamase class C family)